MLLAAFKQRTLAKSRLVIQVLNSPITLQYITVNRGNKSSNNNLKNIFLRIERW